MRQKTSPSIPQTTHRIPEADILFVGITVLLPLYVQDHYFNIVEAKARILTLLCLLAWLLMTIACLRTKGKCLHTDRLCMPDAAVVVIAVTATAVCCLSEDRLGSFWGAYGWGIGGFVLLSLEAYRDLPPLHKLLTMGLVGAAAWCTLYGSVIVGAVRSREVPRLACAVSVIAYGAQALVNSAMATNPGLLCVILACYRRTLIPRKNLHNQPYRFEKTGGKHHEKTHPQRLFVPYDVSVAAAGACSGAGGGSRQGRMECPAGNQGRLQPQR